jgi:hypothetical protein
MAEDGIENGTDESLMKNGPAGQARDRIALHLALTEMEQYPISISMVFSRAPQGFLHHDELKFAWLFAASGLGLPASEPEALEEANIVDARNVLSGSRAHRSQFAERCRFVFVLREMFYETAIAFGESQFEERVKVLFRERLARRYELDLFLLGDPLLHGATTRRIVVVHRNMDVGMDRHELIRDLHHERVFGRALRHDHVALLADEASDRGVDFPLMRGIGSSVRLAARFLARENRNALPFGRRKAVAYTDQGVVPRRALRHDEIRIFS